MPVSVSLVPIEFDMYTIPFISATISSIIDLDEKVHTKSIEEMDWQTFYSLMFGGQQVHYMAAPKKKVCPSIVLSAETSISMNAPNDGQVSNHVRH